MKKIIVIGILMLLLTGMLCGCTEIKNNSNGGNTDKEYFTLSGTITNNLKYFNSYNKSSIYVDLMVYYYLTEDTLAVDPDWQDTILGIFLMPDESESFVFEVKKGLPVVEDYPKYYFMVSWETVTGGVGPSSWVNFTNTLHNDIIYNVEITDIGETKITGVSTT